MSLIFIAFAAEDAWARDYLVGQAKNARTPFNFTDMSVTVPFDSAWKTRARERIQQCHGVIALLSKRTRFADGAKWEMECAVDEGMPMLGVHIHRDDKGEIPPQLNGARCIEWTWDGIARWLDGL